MALYMFKASYTSQAIKTMVENPQDRSGMISKACEAFGGNMIGMYMAFGDDDAIVIAEVPNDVSAAAISAQVASGGACSSVTTTQLLSMSDWVTACEKAKSVSSGYTAPSSQRFMSRFLLSEERLRLISASKNFKSTKIDRLTYSKK